MKYAMSMMFPMIKYHKKIFISPVTKRITLESIKAEYANGSINRIDSIITKGEVRLDMEKDEDTFYNDLFKKSPDKIKIRILCSETLFRPDLPERDFGEVDSIQQVPLRKESGGSGEVTMRIDEIFTKVKEIFKPKKIYFESIVIHIHGGGFVAMSSRCHQTYSR